MTTPFRFDPVDLPAECETLREKARGFIAEELAAGYWTRTAISARIAMPASAAAVLLP
jgi:hypothetical protein